MTIRILLINILLCIAIATTAQTNVSGLITDRETNEPIIGASLIIKSADGKIKGFATSKADGRYTIKVPSMPGSRLEVNMMSYVKQSIPLDSVTLPLDIQMVPGATKLKEVTVKADRIREQGDTVTYNVGSFAQNQDRSIGDVLKRMPGIDVEKSGKIKYQGEDINKFYIEGSDLLGGRYGIATNGINHEDVGAVEVMENHQPMQVLSGISFSDKAAINLKLKNKAKATWSVHGDAAAGYSWQPEGAIWNGELFVMTVMPSFQHITTLKSNNTGDDLSTHATDFFASRRETGLSRYVSVSLPGVPSLNRKRTLFNRSILASTNSLWKLRNGEFKSQIDYSFNRITARAANITTYFLNDGNRIVTENRDGRDRSHSLAGKFIYEVNQKTTYINNTLRTDIDWDDVRLRVSGSLPNEQSASLPDYYVSNKFKMIKRFNGKHLVTFRSDNEWESLPQTLNVSMSTGDMHQHIGDHAFYTHESAAYAFSLKGITVSLEGGIKGYLRSMNSECTGITDLPDDLESVINTNYLTVYATPKLEYWVRRVNLTITAPVSYAHYTFDKALANRSEVYFSPSIAMNWKPNNRIQIGLHGSTGRSPMRLNMIHTGYIMTDYRSFHQGTGDFYNTTSQSVSGNIAYKHTRRGVFANAMVVQSWSHLPYTMSQQLLGDIITYTYTDAKSNGSTTMASGNIGKTLDFMRGSANINGGYNRSRSHLISENSDVASVGTSWRIGAKISGSPLRWLSFDYSINHGSSRMSMNGMKNAWLHSLEQNLLLNLMPHNKWEWRIEGEHYRNELTAGKFKNVFILDTKLVYKLSKRIELSASLTNLLNHRSYNYTTYSQTYSFESQRWLRGRELLLSIYLRK